MRSAAELSKIVSSKYSQVPVILFLYTDGGSDHNLTYVAVELSVTALFLLDLDFICASHTSPYQSWRNPVEQIMFILNLGLQCVGLMRQKMDEDFEKLSPSMGSLLCIGC